MGGPCRHLGKPLTAGRNSGEASMLQPSSQQQTGGDTAGQVSGGGLVVTSVFTLWEMGGF